MSLISIEIAPHFHDLYPSARVGVMVLEKIINPVSSHELEQARTAMEEDLRKRFADKTVLREQPVLQAYKSYYKRFQKTYHVQSQLESVIFGGRPIPNAAPLVEAMFMAELDNMLLTAGHDLARLRSPVQIGIGSEDQSYILMNGSRQNLKSQDMCMSDQEGIISSVVYGPDQRTRLGETTRSALFVVYAPEGIQSAWIEKHFADIEKYIRSFSPAVEKEFQKIF